MGSEKGKSSKSESGFLDLGRVLGGEERTCEPGGSSLGLFGKYLEGVWGVDHLSGVRITKGMGSKVLY